MQISEQRGSYKQTHFSRFWCQIMTRDTLGSYIHSPHKE